MIISDLEHLEIIAEKTKSIEGGIGIFTSATAIVQASILAFTLTFTKTLSIKL